MRRYLLLLLVIFTFACSNSKISDPSAALVAQGGSGPTEKHPGNPTVRVWVNLPTGIYHCPGDRWYGKTKHGKYMTESEAVAAGYRASKQDDEKK